MSKIALVSERIHCTIVTMDAQSKKLQKGFLRAETITKHYAKTFYFASLFLPREKQFAAYAVYAICRISDESVDNAGSNAQASLEQIRTNIETAYLEDTLEEPLLEAFRFIAKTYDIPKIYFEQLLDGMDMDIRICRYQNFQQLYDYCYKVAGVVGLIMLKIFGSTNREAERYAIDLGIAMQLTNIIRDIAEDFQKGRIYLPLEELKQLNVSEEQIGKSVIDENFKKLLVYQIGRARDYYQNASRGIPLITDTKSRFVVSTMKELYAGILSAVEKNNYDVFSKRARVSTVKKIIKVIALAAKQQSAKYLL